MGVFGIQSNYAETPYGDIWNTEQAMCAPYGVFRARWINPRSLTRAFNSVTFNLFIFYHRKKTLKFCSYNKMYVTIKINEDGRNTIHSVTVDGREIIPEYTYTALPDKFIHSGGKNLSVEEVTDMIIKDDEEIQKQKEEWPKELKRREEERKRIEKEQIEYEEMMNEMYGKKIKEYIKASKKIKNTPHYTTKIQSKLFTDLDKKYPKLVEARLVKNGVFRLLTIPPHLQYKTYPDELPDPKDLYAVQTYTLSNPLSLSGRYDQRKYFKKNVINCYNGYCDVSKKVMNSVWKHLEP